MPLGWRRSSENREPGKRQTQNSLETAPEGLTAQSKDTARIDIGPAHQKALKKLPIEEQLDHSAETLLLDILEGRDISQTGPTGKRFKGPANLALRSKAAELWLSKRRPSLQATAVKAEIKNDQRPALSNRQLAQSIIRTLRSAEVEQVIEAEKLSPKKLAAPTGAAVGPPEGAVDAPPVVCKPEEPIDPKHGEKIEALNGTGSYLRYFGPEHGWGGKWGIFNSANVCLGHTPRWDNAVKALMSTPPATGLKHPDPFAMEAKGFEFSERRMERKAQRPRIIKRKRG